MSPKNSATALDRGSVTMKIATWFLLRGSFWTIGAYGIGFTLYLMAGTVPVRLLAIDIFGATSIVYSLRIGVVHLRRWHHSKIILRRICRRTGLLRYSL